MITIKKWMELVDYRITDGTNYLWECYGPNAYSLDSWDGDYDGRSFSIIFDTKTTEVYEVQAHDFKRGRAYRMIHSDYESAHVDSAKNRGTNPNEAWENVEYVNLDVDDDFISKCLAIRADEDYDTRVMMNFEIDEQLEMFIYREAHRSDKTVNQFVEDLLKEFIDTHPINKTSWTLTVEENPENPEELIMPLPEDLLESQGWREGDTLDWTDNGDGTWGLRKIDV
jgi:hypothetical protein